jgi:hypothetical protein
VSIYKAVLRHFPDDSNIYAGSEVLTAMTMKSSIFWHITPCCLMEINDVSEKHISSILGVENGGDMSLQNID